MAGAVVGGLGAGATGGNTSTGVLAGAAAGALIGGVVGMVKDSKERKEQDRLAQERAYQQELARKRAEEARRKAEIDEELAVTQGFRISEMELADAQKKVQQANERLQKLKEERTAALSKTRALDDANEKLLLTEAEIARMEEELARLKSDDAASAALAPSAPAPTGGTSAPAAGPNKAPGAP
jgi:predicted acylesterase/phospholipase RssA